ncbi:hypothetical protein HMPREF9194_00792 [Treponema maltophilum ATCC 51939]|uniref:Polymorphic outer membrane protein n=1 Tax=Treponema maltophilum ATCC 51939 TaxID=1125699 RepID=S3JZ23_TREMA|nr:hypothetical protein [Treponema maltophilum]EPF30475.1 hypothetical protein HMPREF9194_00792 [Treponema maltophilum ATCC 51939]
MKRSGKNFIRAAVCAAVIALLFGMTACKQFTADIDEEFGYWASEVVPVDYSFDVSYQMSNDGALCIPSDSPVTLTIKLHNSRKFSLIMPTSTSSAADVQKIIRFPGLSTQPTYGTDYTLEQTPDKSALRLKYGSTFLKAHEWSNGNIGAEITLTSTDGRKFGKKFSLNIEANTPPPEIGDITIAKTNEADPHYVLCFKVDNSAMNTTIAGENLHNDLGLVITKEGGETKKILLPIESSGFAVDTTNGLLSSASQIIDPVPSGTWKVCFKTGTSLTESTLPQKYTVRLIDTKGLSSAPKEAHTLGYIASGSSPTNAWKNLKEAVESAEAGGVITVMGEVKATNATDNHGAISVTKKITVKGTGLTPVLNADKDIGGKPKHRIFTVENGGELTLENITLKGGMAAGTTDDEQSGGGIFVKAGCKAKLTNCIIKNCEAAEFGGAICSEGELTLDRGTIGGSAADANKANQGGGICIQKNGRFTLKTATISGNKASYGGAISVRESGSVSMESGFLMRNTVSSLGGGVLVDNSASFTSVSFTMTGGEIKNNTGQSGGGGVFVHRGTFTLSGGTIESNTADAGKNGGGIYVDSTGKLFITGGSIKLNKTTKNGSDIGKGGGVYVDGSSKVTLVMSGGSIEGNEAGKNGSTYEGSGGGVHIDRGTFTMTGGEIKTNNAKNGGGVALDKGGTLELSGSGEISGNTAENNGLGGGICVGTDADANENTGTLTMTGGEISDNTANGGGGIAVLHGTFTMSKGKVSGNTAAQKGGGIFGYYYSSTDEAKGEITVLDGEISGNTAEASGVMAGGGICSLYKLTVSGGDIKNNTATNGFGGGIGVNNETFDFSGGTVSGNMTLSSVPTSALGKGIFVDRRVTMTMSGSAKVDTGNDVYLGNDGTTTRASITVTAPLTNTLAATLTMENDTTGYEVGRVVVKGDGYTLTTDYKDKFPITPQTLPTSKDWTTELAGNQLKLKTQ